MLVADVAAVDVRAPDEVLGDSDRREQVRRVDPLHEVHAQVEELPVSVRVLQVLVLVGESLACVAVRAGILGAFDVVVEDQILL